MKPPHADALQEHAGFIRALARGLLSDPDQADDIVQETCLAALRHPPRHRANLRAWLGTVARNLAFRRHRSARRRAHHEARAVRPDRLPSPAELAERMELQRKVLNAVDSLEEPFRASLIFRYFDDLTPSEIAGHLQIPVKTVKSRLNRALSKLRARLDYDHGGDRTAWSALLLPMVLPTAHAGAATAGGALATGGVVITMKKAVVLFVVVFLGAALVVWQAVATHEDPSTPRSRAERQEPGSQAGGNATTKTGTGARAETPLPILGRGDEIPAFTFAGRVVDSQGRGVGGAEVRLFYWAATADDHTHYSAKALRPEYERHEGPSARTGPDGHFRLDRPYRSRSYLRAHAKGFFPAVTEVHEPGEFILITLGGEESLRVRVVDVRARPVAEATVRLVTASGRSMTRHVLAEEKTDTAGLAHLPRPGDGGLRLEVDPKDPDLGFVEHLVDPTRDEVEISVPSVETLVRRIVDVDTGAPVPDAYVMIMRPGGSGFPTERQRFLVDAKGLVRIPPTGAPPARATAPGYEVAHVGLAEEVRISQAMLVEGVVLDKRGHPVSDVPVLVAVPPGGMFVRVFSGLPVVAAWSNEQGRFDLYIKAPAGAYDAGVRSLIGLHAEYAPAVVDSIRVLPGRFKQ
ncbi:MAG: RNA polymerase sigma factor, partial [Longimicrobiales bacterium]